MSIEIQTGSPPPARKRRRLAEHNQKLEDALLRMVPGGWFAVPLEDFGGSVEKARGSVGQVRRQLEDDGRLGKGTIECYLDAAGQCIVRRPENVEAGQ